MEKMLLDDKRYQAIWQTERKKGKQKKETQEKDISVLLFHQHKA